MFLLNFNKGGGCHIKSYFAQALIMLVLRFLNEHVVALLSARKENCLTIKRNKLSSMISKLNSLFT